MPAVRRSRVVAAAPDEVWRILDDPHQLPRWWPGVQRVEAVEGDRFTEVVHTAKGRPVRLDLRVSAREPGRLLRWEQELAGTPFERHLAESIVELRLAPDVGGTNVTIEQRQRLHGLSRGGGWMLRRSGVRRLERALAGLAAIVG